MLCPRIRESVRPTEHVLVATTFKGYIIFRNESETALMNWKVLLCLYSLKVA
jgi:hypothetical protein